MACKAIWTSYQCTERNILCTVRGYEVQTDICMASCTGLNNCSILPFDSQISFAVVKGSVSRVNTPKNKYKDKCLIFDCLLILCNCFFPCFLKIIYAYVQFHR